MVISNFASNREKFASCTFQCCVIQIVRRRPTKCQSSIKDGSHRVQS